MFCLFFTPILRKKIAPFSYSFGEKVCLFLTLFEKEFAVFTHILRKGCFFHTIFIAFFNTSKTIHGEIKNGPPPNNKKQKNAFLSLI